MQKTIPLRAFRLPSRRRCLAAVASRDARMDRAFVYAVRSTGILLSPVLPIATLRGPIRSQSSITVKMRNLQDSVPAGDAVLNKRSGT